MTFPLPTPITWYSSQHVVFITLSQSFPKGVVSCRDKGVPPVPSFLRAAKKKNKKTKKQKRKTCFVPVGIANVSLSYWSLLFFFPPKNQFLPSIHKPSLYVTVSLSFLLSVVIGWSLVMDMEIHKFDTGGDLSDTTKKSIDHWSKSTNVHPRPRSGPWHSLPLFAPIFPPLLLTFAAPRYPSLSLFSLINFR